MTGDDSNAKIYHLRELVNEIEGEQRKRLDALAAGTTPGPVTGLRSLDKELGGVLSRGLHILQAAPGAGKSALSLQIAARCGYPAVYVTTEMSPIELFRRTIARETRTALNTLNDKLSAEQIRDLAIRTAESVNKMVIVDGSVRIATRGTIENAVFLLSCESSQLPLVVIDSFQMWARAAAFQTPFRNEYDVMTQAIRTLSEMSMELGLPILCIAHRSRVGQEKGGLHASKGTGDIEYAADTVIELSRDADDQPNARGELEVVVKILKNRHGSPGAEIPLMFTGSLQYFREA